MTATQEFVVPRSIPITLAMLTLRGTFFRPPAAAACRHPQARGATLGCRALLQPSVGTLTAIKAHGLVPKVPARPVHTEMSGRHHESAAVKLTRVKATQLRHR